MTERLPLLRRLLAEALGTLILVATIVGSGATAGALVCMFLFPAPKVHSVRARAPGEEMRPTGATVGVTARQSYPPARIVAFFCSYSSFWISPADWLRKDAFSTKCCLLSGA